MKQKYLILFSLSGLVLSLDQLTKRYVHGHLPLGTEYPILKGFMSLKYTRTNGFAFGLVQKAPPSLQEIFFIGIPVFALILIVLIFIKLRDNQTRTSVALTTILAGAVGNLVDRIQYGFVVDFLDLRLGTARVLPPFNIADASIILGVLLMFVNTIRQERGVTYES